MATKKGSKASSAPTQGHKGSGRTGTRGVASAELGQILTQEDPERFWTLLNDAVFPRYERLGLEGLSRPEQVAHCIDWLVREVDDKGIRKWLEEPSGNHPYETLEALKAIGADHTFELLELVFAAFPEEVPDDQDERLALMEDFTGRERRALKEFDAAWADYQDDLMGLLKDHLEEQGKEWGRE